MIKRKMIVSNEIDTDNAFYTFRGYEPLKEISLKATDGNLVSIYPVKVFNVNGSPIGIANDKKELIDLWNNDKLNQQYGRITGAVNPFAVTIKLNLNKNLNSITANPTDEIVDVDGISIADSTNETILIR